MANSNPAHARTKTLWLHGFSPNGGILLHLETHPCATSAPSNPPTSTTISHYSLSIIKVSLYSLVFFVFLCILKNNISYDTSAMTTICTNTLCYVPTQLSTIASATD